MEDNFYDETMDMPTPCEHCNTIFDLNDGYGSEKWHPNITICADCHDEEEKEIEEDDYYDTLNEELCNALYGIEEKKGAWERLDKENQALIIQLVSQRSKLLKAEDKDVPFDDYVKRFFKVPKMELIYRSKRNNSMMTESQLIKYYKRAMCL